MGFLQWLSGKESACSAGDTEDLGSVPGLWKILWRRKWQPSPVFLLGKSHGEMSWWATINPWDGKESEMTQHARTLCIYILKVKAISLNKKTDK